MKTRLHCGPHCWKIINSNSSVIEQLFNLVIVVFLKVFAQQNANKFSSHPKSFLSSSSAFESMLETACDVGNFSVRWKKSRKTVDFMLSERKFSHQRVKSENFLSVSWFFRVLMKFLNNFNESSWNFYKLKDYRQLQCVLGNFIWFCIQKFAGISSRSTSKNVFRNIMPSRSLLQRWILLDRILQGSCSLTLVMLRSMFINFIYFQYILLYI